MILAYGCKLATLQRVNWPDLFYVRVHVKCCHFARGGRHSVLKTACWSLPRSRADQVGALDVNINRYEREINSCGSSHFIMM